MVRDSVETPATPLAPPRRVTMAQVAGQAGVHVTTVSLARRNRPSLSAATRARLLPGASSRFPFPELVIPGRLAE